MAKKPDPTDELADFDPEAPPEDPPDELAIERSGHRNRILLLVVSFALLGALLWYRFGRESGPSGLVAQPLDSPIVNLAGNEIATLGLTLAGPYALIEAKSGDEVEMAPLNAQANETFQLIGLSDSDYMSAREARALPPAEQSARFEKIREMEAFRRDAIAKFCGAKPHYVLRYPAAKGVAAPAFLLQVIGDSNTSANPRQPTGQAYLVNAWLLREGKASLLLNPNQPFYDPLMLDCQLASFVAAEKGLQPDSIWKRFGLKLPADPALEARLKRIRPLIRD